MANDDQAEAEIGWIVDISSPLTPFCIMRANVGNFSCFAHGFTSARVPPSIPTMNTFEQ